LLSDWQSAFKRLSVIFLGLLVLGWLLGETALVLLCGLFIYLAYHLIQLRRLHNWLQNQDQAQSTPPPESRGIWAYVFDGIYLLQRRERDALSELRNIIDKAQESTAALEIGVVMINSNNALVWWNPAASQLLGLQNPKDRKQAVTNLIRDPKFVEYFSRANFGTPLKLGSHVNSAIMLEYQITGFGEGERLMLVRDISQLHRLETMRKDFIGNVSHELRTPITVISGYLETMLDDKENLPTRWIKPLEQMAQQSQRMENIVRDLLTLSRLETRPSSDQQSIVHLRSMLLDIKHDAERLFEDKQHSFRLVCAKDIYLQGSPIELYSAASNLILNAAKYTQSGGEIELSAVVSDTGLTVSVTDNGPGIAAHHIPRLTERFYRLDESRSTDTGGTGLGLAIVKHVVARHGGRLEIRSEVGKGSSFICQFPAERLRTAEQAKAEARTAEQARAEAKTEAKVRVR